MEIAESMYKGVAETSYKSSTWSYANRAGCSRNKRKEYASSNTYPATVESAGKCRKRYVDCLTSGSKTCLIHGAGNSAH